MDEGANAFTVGSMASVEQHTERAPAILRPRAARVAASLPQLSTKDIQQIQQSRRGFLLAKRLVDVAIAAFILLLSSPLMLILAMLIKLHDGGPVFFRQQRLTKGIDGPRVFRIIKFRSMVVDAERRGTKITPERDPRITPVGRFLRKTKLDELPQLFNILRGEMSFIGPRPQTMGYVKLFREHYELIHTVLPAGLTDLATLRYRDEGKVLARCDDPEAYYIEHIMPEKISWHYHYLQHMGLVLDISIMCRTWAAVFIHKPLAAVSRLFRRN